MQREEQPPMATGLERIAVLVAVNQSLTSVVREIRTLRSVGAGGGRPPLATRSGDGRPPLRPGGYHVSDIPTAIFRSRNGRRRPLAGALEISPARNLM